MSIKIIKTDVTEKKVDATVNMIIKFLGGINYE